MLKRKKAVGTDLQQDARQDHAASRGRLDVRQRQPGMQGKERNLDRESSKQRQEDPDLQIASASGSIRSAAVIAGIENVIARFTVLPVQNTIVSSPRRSADCRPT